METSTCAPHGLWRIRLDDGLARIAAFGFNTVRLPFSNECLRAKRATSIDPAKNPGLANRTPLQIMDVIVRRAEAHGLSIILDRHRPSSAGQSALWYTARYPERVWIADWRMLAKRYASSPTVIGVDLHNEPHGRACWGCGNASTDWARAATRAGNAILAVNPRLLIIVQGVERQRKGVRTWWGGGLVDVGSRPLRLNVPRRVVYSPHEYPKSVYPQKWFSAPNYPNNLKSHWDRNWGYLSKKGVAPIFIGEFGTKLATRSDRQWLKSLVTYVRTNKMSFGYWSFNPNSSDTGGLVRSDWVTTEKTKLTALQPILTPARTRSHMRPTPTNKPAQRTPSATKKPATTAASSLHATWRRETWPSGYVAHVTVTSRVGTKHWTARWADPTATSVVSSWGMRCSVAGGQVTCRGSDWAQRIPARSTVKVGVQVARSGPAHAQPKLLVSSG
jgi:endoglucanase